MSQQRAILWAFIGSVVMFLVLGVAGLWYVLERVEVETDGDRGPRARANPYLAMTRVLNELGLPATAQPALGLPADASESVVFVFSDHQRLTVQQAERLLGWVERGGVAVVALPPTLGEPDPLYARLGIEAVAEGMELDLGLPFEAAEDDAPEAEGDADEGEEAGDAAESSDQWRRDLIQQMPWPLNRWGQDEAPAEEAPEDAEAANAEEAQGDSDEDSGDASDDPALVIDARELRTLALYDGEWDAEVRERRWLQARGSSLQAEQLAGVDPEHRPARFTAALFSRGEGALIALADPSVFDNDHLADLDHAALLWRGLAREGLGFERAAVIYRIDDQDLLDKLLEVALPAVLSALALVLAWLWRSWGRFGPLAAPPRRARRSLLEHIEASGAFLWRHGEQGVMLESLRAEVLRGRHLSQAGPEGETDQDRVTRIAARSRAEPELVRQALCGGEENDKRAFTDTVAALQELRRKR